nr:MAG TPA: hypothetical protein [Caudoviricetes sp.]
MTNYEHYKKQIEKFTRMGQKVAVKKDTNEIIPCSDIGCGGCLFGGYDSCTKKSMAWADAEYIEPEVDWTKVPVDTPILVRNLITYDWIERHFAKYEYNFVYAWCDGKTSYTTDSTNYWNYAKLANEN